MRDRTVVVGDNYLAKKILKMNLYKSFPVEKILWKTWIVKIRRDLITN